MALKAGVGRTTINPPLDIPSGMWMAQKHVRGEGLVGLARGFMHAGAPRVVASYWDVKDEATFELMRRFYRGMLLKHLAPAAALRAAQQLRPFARSP